MARLSHLKGDSVQQCRTQTQQVQLNMFLHLFISIIFKSTHKRSYTTMSVLSRINTNGYNDS